MLYVNELAKAQVISKEQKRALLQLVLNDNRADVYKTIAAAVAESEAIHAGEVATAQTNDQQAFLHKLLTYISAQQSENGENGNTH